jgi:hypothetical protein
MIQARRCHSHRPATRPRGRYDRQRILGIIAAESH